MKYEFNIFSDDRDKVCVTESIFIPDDMVMHTHEFCEIVYIKSGNATHVLNNTERSIKQGDLIIISCADAHTFKNGDRNFIWYNCIFMPSIFSRIYKIAEASGHGTENLLMIRVELCMVKHEHPLVLHKCQREIENLFDEMQKAQFASKSGSNSIMHMLLTVLLIKIAELISEYRQYENTYTASDLLNLVYSYFHASSAYPKIKLSDIAKKAHMEPTAFSKLFKKKVGCGLSKVIQKIRFDKAAYLLETSNMSVNEIMKYVGYEDTKYFFDSFSKRYSTTPQQYRKLKNETSKKP